jgi:complement component 1 Q subcomponent-binding protein, mitochondrial
MPGQDMVKLERKFGNETIRVMFSIADLDAMAETEYAEGESESEGEEGSQGTVTSPPIRVSIAVRKV